jgi:hypothetical protein
VRFGFDAPLLAGSVDVEDLDMTMTGGAGTPVLPTSAALWPDGRTVVFTLPVFFTDDGEYRIAIKAGAVQSVDGLHNPSDAVLPSEESFILTGDINRDRKVDFADLLIVAQNYGQTGRTFSQGNIDYSADGVVGFDDLLLLAQRYGTSLVVGDVAPAKVKSRRRVIEL